MSWVFPIGDQPIEGGQELFREELVKLGRTRTDEKVVFGVFLLTAGLWIFRPLIQQITIGDSMPFSKLSDTGVALISALLLFVLPSFENNSDGRQLHASRLMNWDNMKELPWGLLLLFGGGLSLASAIKETGLSALLADQFGILQGAPSWIVLLAVIGLVVFLTELTSNLATVATMMALLASLAEGLSMAPAVLLVPAAMAGSCAFMLPVATPPNAIVYGSGHITTPQMVRAGFWLNVVCTTVLLLVALTLVGWVVTE